jgi:Sec-independent protein translocase protein TatA
MIGALEIAIIAVVLLLVFGYRYLPVLGRRAGETARAVKESVQGAIGDKADPKKLGETAGRGVREAREFRDALTGKSEASRPASDADERPEEADEERPSPQRDV